MRVALVGADFEENLGVGMVAAAAAQDGHDVTVVPFNRPESLPAVVDRVLEGAPDVIGLSIQFQHRATEFLDLARALRAAGFTGHLTCGGQFPTLACNEVLRHHRAVDTVVLHEGEAAFTELLAALETGTPPGQVRGLAVRNGDGGPARTSARRICDDLDSLPFAVRYRRHTRHVGVPFIPIMGGRGCWGRCTYCSITSFYRDAKAQGGGRTLRHRSPENVAAEMAMLWHAAGGPSVYCFHDDNFLLPRPEASLARVSAIRAALDGFGVGRAGMIGKCRPDSLTPELARSLRELGVIRLYVGVENASQHGSDHLNRRNQTARVAEALRACREAGIFVCYNLLLFEPDARIDDVRENIAFMRDHAMHPVNFCRAEPYVGTPLALDLAERRGLGGSYLGHSYRVEDDETELLFRVCSSAFRQRNFDPAGVANRSMGLGYTMKLLEYFYDDPRGRRPMLARRTEKLTRAIVSETAGLLETAIALVERHRHDPDGLARQTALLGLRVAAADRARHAELDEIYSAYAAFARDAAEPPRAPLKPPSRVLALTQSVVLGASLAVWVGGCSSHNNDDEVEQIPNDPVPVDPVPSENVQPNDDIMPADPVPSDPIPVDPPPPDMPPQAQDDNNPPPVDPAPPPSDTTTRHHDKRPPPPPPPMDPVPEDRPPVVDPAPAPHKGEGKATLAPRLPLIDQWRDTTARKVTRTQDLPLFDPPEVSLSATRRDDAVEVTVAGGPEAVSLRWQSEGRVVGSGRTITWYPSSERDQIRVAVRSLGGVAVTALRACDV